jgi:hypothetical protein
LFCVVSWAAGIDGERWGHHIHHVLASPSNGLGLICRWKLRRIRNHYVSYLNSYTSQSTLCSRHLWFISLIYVRGFLIPILRKDRQNIISAI